jgi:hypothetical protein
MKTFRPFILIASLVAIVSLACGAVSPSEPAAIPTLPPVPTRETQQDQQQQQQQQDVQPTDPPVSSSGPFFTEEFDSNPQWYYEVIQDSDTSDPDNITVEFDSGRMIFDIPDPYLYAYYVYEGHEYEDVRVEIEIENRGVNSQQVSLLCHVDDEGWYEWAVQSDGLWVLYAVSGGFSRLTNGGSNDINQGKDVNEYAMECEGNEISFFINGEEQRGSPYIDREYGLSGGNVGFSISALRAVPVKIEVEKFTISEP